MPQHRIRQATGLIAVRSNGQHIHIRKTVPVAPGPGPEQPEAAARLLAQHNIGLLLQRAEPLDLLAAANVGNRYGHAPTLWADRPCCKRSVSAGGWHFQRS